MKQLHSLSGEVGLCGKSIVPILRKKEIFWTSRKNKMKRNYMKNCSSHVPINQKKPCKAGCRPSRPITLFFEISFTKLTWNSTDIYIRHKKLYIIYIKRGPCSRPNNSRDKIKKSKIALAMTILVIGGEQYKWSITTIVLPAVNGISGNRKAAV